VVALLRRHCGQEGTRVLEDQLRLMDERYIDLRGKLDWTKANNQKKVTKILSQTAHLENKWTQALSATSGSAAVPHSAWS
jgi:hypothetical protein